MPGFNNPDFSGSVTPNRTSSMEFDVAEWVCVSRGTAVRRAGHQIAATASRDKGTDSFYTKDVYLWSCGAWSLRPLQADMARLQEKGLPAGSPDVIYRPGATAGAAGLGVRSVGTSEINLFKSMSGAAPGLITSANANAGGDSHYQKSVAATTTFATNVTVSTSAGQLPAAIQSALGTDFTQPLDPIWSTYANQAADQPYCLRWYVPGHKQATYDIIAAFAFGQYALAIHGNGEAALWEFAAKGAAAAIWRKRRTFHYCRQNQVTGENHILLIWPTLGPRSEKLIVFHGNHLLGNESGGAALSSVPGSQQASGGTTSQELVYRYDEAESGGTVDTSPVGGVTTAAPFAWFVRRDIRATFQISRLAFRTSGQIVDHPVTSGNAGAAAGRVHEVTVTKTERAGNTITTTINDVATQSATTTPTDPYVQFDFVGTGNQTPVLWSFVLNQQAQIPADGMNAPGDSRPMAPVTIVKVTPGKFTAPIRTVAISGNDGDPRRERGSVLIRDKDDSCYRLRRRGILSARLRTTFTPPGEAPVNVVLFRGFALRPNRTKIGKHGRKNGFTQQGAAAILPAEEASEYSVTLAGMWQRLTEVTSRTATAWALFGVDDTAAANAEGAKPCWKVTDVIKYLLYVAGFPPKMINIPDNPIRLHYGITGGSDDTRLDVSTNIAEQIVSLARNYLGQFLHFDANGGELDGDNVPLGQWTLLVAPSPDAPAVYHFVTFADLPAGQAPTAFWQPNSIAAKTSLAFSPLEMYTVPPEANHLVVVTAADPAKAGGGYLLENHVYNWKSYQVPGWSVAPDPDSAHYIGRELVLYKVDLGLWDGDGPGSALRAQKAVDYLTRRYFNYACLPRQVVHIMVAFDPVKDAVTNRWRPLRFYDPVTVNGVSFYVRSNSIHFSKDGFMLADMELERVITLATAY